MKQGLSIPIAMLMGLVRVGCWQMAMLPDAE